MVESGGCGTGTERHELGHERLTRLPPEMGSDDFCSPGH